MGFLPTHCGSITLFLTQIVYVNKNVNNFLKTFYQNCVINRRLKKTRLPAEALAGQCKLVGQVGAGESGLGEGQKPVLNHGLRKHPEPVREWAV